MRLRAIIMTVCVSVVALISTPASSAESWKWINPERVQRLLNEGGGFWLIDIRPEAEYEKNHIEGSININALKLRYSEPPKNKPLVLVDDSLGQMHAVEAAEALFRKGYENVYALEGGLYAWKKTGYATVGGDSRPVRGVSAHELKWAMENAGNVRVFDLRGADKIKAGAIKGSRAVEGGDLRKRINNLRAVLSTDNKKLKAPGAPMETVLVFSAADDAESLAAEVSEGLDGSVGYLIGGYEVYDSIINGKKGGVQKEGTCPSGLDAIGKSK